MTTRRAEEVPPGGALPPAVRLGVYACFFLSGGTALTLEVVWSRQFVTVFGNSSYAISVVLCAFMAGLGVGALVGGRLADRSPHRLALYGLAQAGVALWALGVPAALELLRRAVPAVPLLASGPLLVPSLARFAISFALLVVPCGLMGTTLPLLSRFCTESSRMIGRRVGALYGLNTLGAAAGCFAAGYWLVDTYGLSAAGQVAVVVNLGIAAFAALIVAGLGAPALAPASPAALAPERRAPGPRSLLLAAAFITGMAGLTTQVLWVRYLAFFSNVAYAFTAILGVYLLGLGLGSLLYRAFLARRGRPARALAWALIALGLAVACSLPAGVLVLELRDPGAVELLPMTGLTVLVPTVLMGMAFPLICAAYAGSVARVGRRVGAVYALNTAGSMVGAMLPVFLLIPLAGIQAGIFLMALLYVGVGAALLMATAARSWARRVLAPALAGGAVLAFAAAAPGDLCRRALLASSVELGRHVEVIFYREGRTGTASVVRDRVSGLKRVYINGMREVPTNHAALQCFKLMGVLGPLLHPEPDEALMICFGGGGAAGAAVQCPAVRSLEVVDLESSVVEAARLLEEENNGLLANPKVKVTIDDGRNYLLAAQRTWPVIVSDSTHPKSSDSWVLYTQEFYRTVRSRLRDGGVFVLWLPVHGMSVAEYKIIVRTFLSVFPHSSLWASHGVTEHGHYGGYSLLVATPQPLSIDVAALERRLADPVLARDLAPYGLDTVAGLLERFVCDDERLRAWVGEGPVNTDDLPLTQYRTRHSRGPECSVAFLAELTESIWPRLTNTGDQEQDRQLQQTLAVRLRFNRLLMANLPAPAFALRPDDVRVRTYWRNLESGQRYVRQVAAYYPDSPAHLNWLAGLARWGPGGPELAEALYRMTLAVDPADPMANVHVGTGLQRRGNAAEAAAHYRRALQAEPKYAAAHNNLASALAALGQREKAMEHWQVALRLNPYLAEAHNNVGLELARDGRFAEAAEHFARAFQFKPTFLEARYHLAMALLPLGRVDEAVRALEALLDLDPHHAGAHALLAQVRQRSPAPAPPGG